ncbi:MAG: amidohydrolase family protein, partial [Acidobacteriota bacterium]|nr:amidohydrolase family protein [Acidobacteriota bacterium]
MRSRTTFLLLILIAGLNSASLARGPGVRMTAIVNVNVIPMDSEILLRNRTVLIEGEKIIAIGPTAAFSIPKSAKIIDGKDKFLIPGLIDMHVHFEEKHLPLYLANGVTTIRNLNGDSTHLEIRKKLDQGKLDGPRVYTAGPLITVPETRWKIKAVPASADDARKIVRSQKAAGYDFIKVYDGLSKDVYDAILAEAKVQDIRVVGHIPTSVGLKGAAEKGQSSIDHAEQIVYSHIGFPLDEKKIQGAVSIISQAKIWVCPTLAVQEIFKLNRQAKFAGMLDNPEMKFVDPDIMDWWKSFAKESASDHQKENSLDFYDFQVKLTRALFESGVPILAGTDAPNPGMVHGFALHEELRNLVNAGLSPYEALKTATVNGALFLGAEKRFGTIKAGMIADLALLDGNPLENIAATKNISGVMSRGKWHSKSELRSLLT